MGRQPGDVAAIECNGSRGRRKEAADQVEEGGLAGAVGSDDRAQFPLGDVERHIAHRDQIAESLGDTPDFKNVHALLR
jgi:hypothetical protein